MQDLRDDKILTLREEGNEKDFLWSAWQLHAINENWTQEIPAYVSIRWLTFNWCRR